MNRRCGAAPTQTPPKPTSRPLTRFRWSAKTLRVSNRPSPSVSSKIRMRSCAWSSADAPRVGIGLGDPEPAAVVDRHGDRLDDVGLAGEERDLEARRHGHRPRGLLGAEAGVPIDVERRGPAPGRDGRLGVVQPEVVEVDVAPAAALAIHQPDHDLLAQVLRTGRRPRAPCPRDRRPTPGRRPGPCRCGPARRASPASEPPPTRKLANGLVTRNGTEVKVPSARRRRPRKLPTQNRPGVPAVHVAATPVNGVALDRLTLEGIPLGRPVGQGAGLEVQVERASARIEPGPCPRYRRAASAHRPLRATARAGPQERS